MNNSFNIQSIQELLLRQRDNTSIKVHGEEKSSSFHLKDLQSMHRSKMSRNAHTDTEQVQYVLRKVEGYGKIAVPRLFVERYENIPPARSTIREWYEAYQSRGIHAHTSGNERPRIRSTVRNEIHELFENNSRTSLRELASEKGVAHATVWKILRRELRLFPYKIQKSRALTEDHATNILRFSRYFSQKLRNGNNYLERFVFSNECKFSFSVQVNSQTVESGRHSALMRCNRRPATPLLLCFGVPYQE